MRYLSFLCFFISSFFVSAQNRDYGVLYKKGLKVGDKMPDIELGTVVNNNTGKYRFSQFKGRLVILDFWNTNCTSCIASFPEMERLQNEFGSKIQIFMVNPWETEAQIEKAVATANGVRYRLPKLPSIVNAKKLGLLFPARSIPHHVWINRNGVIEVRGSNYNTYDQKIRDALSGKSVYVLNDDNTVMTMDKTTPYYQVLRNPIIKMPIQQGSLFTTFNNNYGLYGWIQDVVDSSIRTIRSTYINQDVISLYESAYSDLLEQQWQKIIYSPNKPDRSTDFFNLLIKDTLRYTYKFKSESHLLIDKDIVKSSYCYEQINSLNCSKEVRRIKMREDLNDFFGNLYGLKVSVEKREIKCYVLIRTSGENKLLSKNDGGEENIIEDGKKMIRMNKTVLGRSGAIWRVIDGSPLLNSLRQKQNGQPLFILDETGISDMVDIVLPDPSEIKTLNDLKLALMKYDLDLIESEREMDFLIFTDQPIVSESVSLHK